MKVATSRDTRITEALFWLFLGAGVVLEVGAEVTDVAVGDKVLLSYSYCGACTQCTSGHAPYCENLFSLNFGGQRQDGTTAFASNDDTSLHSHFFGQSSFSKKTVVRHSSIVKIPGDASLQLFAPLGCGLQTGAGAVLNTLNVTPGSTVAVFGVGSVGLSAVMAAAIRGAREIIAIDVQPGRLSLAKELGATTTINSSEEDVLERVKTICPPTGVKFALDCSGIPKVIEKMVDCLGPRGRGCSVGAPAPGKRASIDVFSHLIMGREYVGCHQGEADAQKVRISVAYDTGVPVLVWTI
jgi:Zn-dependent alcohol dehydrogenase